jgi:hypothetical protein
MEQPDSGCASSPLQAFLVQPPLQLLPASVHTSRSAACTWPPRLPLLHEPRARAGQGLCLLRSLLMTQASPATLSPHSLAPL